MITSIFHVSVSGSEELAEMLNIDKEKARAFDGEVHDARNYSVDSGANYYSKWEEWADFHDLKHARAFEQKLKVIIAKYETQVEAWKKAYYAED